MDIDVQQQALRIDEDVALATEDFFPGIVAGWVEETHGQRDRLEEAPSRLSEKPFVLKEGFLGLVGNMMALGRTPSQDEILKNAFANQAFENFEIDLLATASL